MSEHFSIASDDGSERYDPRKVQYEFDEDTKKLPKSILKKSSELSDDDYSADFTDDFEGEEEVAEESRSFGDVPVPPYFPGNDMARKSRADEKKRTPHFQEFEEKDKKYSNVASNLRNPNSRNRNENQNTGVKFHPQEYAEEEPMEFSSNNSPKKTGISVKGIVENVMPSLSNQSVQALSIGLRKIFKYRKRTLPK